MQASMLGTRKHGSSHYLQPTPAGFIGEAEFYDFAPAPVSFLDCLISSKLKGRMYMHVYENRVEINNPLQPFLCCTTENCVIDKITVAHHDRLPSRVGMCLGCPCTCCGPPVIFAYKPKCFMIDCSDMCGQQIRYAPCNMYGCKECICCCNPCYARCSVPLVHGTKHPEQFLSAWKFAVQMYAQQKGLPMEEMAIFEAVNDNVFDFGAARGIQDPQIKVYLEGGPAVVGQPVQAVAPMPPVMRQP